MNAAVFLRSITPRPVEEENQERYPFAIPAIRTLARVEFSTPVTFFAGENGSGKSTLLEAIAAGAKSIPARSGDAVTESTLAPAALLAEHLTLSWQRRSRHGLFLRGEDFFDFTRRMSTLMGEMAATAEDFDRRFTGYGRDLARAAALEQRRALAERYGEDPHARSHGEGFLQFFRARFTGPGLYLLDEPDTALSVQSVLALIAMIRQMTAEGAQFIIATHSPVLLALPGARIISFDRAPIAAVGYDEVEQVELLRAFLAHPQAFLRQL